MAVTALLCTDIEGSTRLIEKDPVAYAAALQIHHEILRRIALQQGGEEFHDAGDGLFFAFPDAVSAAQASAAMQCALAEAVWPRGTGSLHVRMLLHWAETTFREGQHRGPGIHLAARMLAAGHGGQVLCSRAAADAISGHRTLKLILIGAYRLRGFDRAEEIFQLQLNGQGASFPPLRADQARRHNLPFTLDSFFGRDEEIVQLEKLLRPTREGVRLVSLTGPGGVGKTRLALASAHGLLPAYDHGIVYVPLAETADANSIPMSILSAAGVQDQNQADPLKQLAEVFCGMPTLVILDNFEHLAGEGGALLARLLSLSPEIRLLVTSRSRLGISGETELPLSPFPLPAEDETSLQTLITYECVKLFSDRACRARPGFVLEERHVPSVAGICRLLDGLPLAIELAAARLQVITPGELCDALREGTGDSVQHGGLERVFDWSRNLLPDDIAGFFDALSLFRGGWTAQASAALAGVENTRLALAYLHYLLTCSLIRVSESQSGMRFAMLEPIRQMAESRLKERRPALCNQHCAYFQKLAQRAPKEIGTDREQALTHELDAESPNILAALDRESSNQIRIYTAVDFSLYATYRACNRALRPFLSLVRPDGGDVKPGTLARAWSALGGLLHATKELEEARIALTRALELSEAAGEEFGVVSSRYNLALVADELGHHREAYLMSLETLGYFRSRQLDAECAVVLSNLAIGARRIGQFEEAKAHARECILLSEKIGDQPMQAHGLMALGLVLIETGDDADAIFHLSASLQLTLASGGELRLVDVMAALGRAAVLVNEYCSAAFFLGAAQETKEKYRILPSVESAGFLSTLEHACRRGLDPVTFGLEIARGESACPSGWMSEARQLLLPAPSQSPAFSV